MIEEKILKWQNIIIIVIATAVVLFSFFYGNYEKTTYRNSYETTDVVITEVDLPDGSITYTNDYPLKYKLQKGTTMAIHAMIPENISENYAVVFPTNYSMIRIFSSDVLLGSYAVEQPLPYGHMVGNIRLITGIPKDYAGQELIIQVTPFYSSSFSFDEIQFGNADALKIHVIYKNIWRIALASILFTITVICIGISFAHHTRKLPTNNWAFYHMGCFLFYIQLWIVCSSDIPQFFTNANETVSLVSFISLAVVCIHYAAFSIEVIQGSRRFFSRLQIISWFVPLIEVVLFVTDIAEPPDILIINHLQIAIICLGVIYMTLKNARSQPMARLYAYANTILVASAIGALAMFYKYKTGGYDAVILGVGIVIYSMVLFFIIMKMELDYIRDMQTNEVYRELAYKDIMTGLNNRRAFNERMEFLDGVEAENTPICLSVLDINRLKQINDTLGHEKGDELIIGAADCIKKSFSNVGDCYRIGGDEFAVIAEGNNEILDEGALKLQNNIDAFNVNHENLGLSISIGVASGVCSGDGFSIRLFKEADERMYIEKDRWHHILDAKG